MGKKKSLSFLIKAEYSKACCYGRSKHADKSAENNYHPYGIYSVKTYENYARQGIAFGSWCKEKYGCSTVQDCKPYVLEYLDYYSNGKSASSVHTAKYALQKLYSISDHEYKVEFKHAKRERCNITKNRGSIEDVKDFKEEKYNDLLSFAQACGLRRHELLNLRYRDISLDGTGINVVSGKGGKPRHVIISAKNMELIAGYAAKAPDPDAYVWNKSQIPSRTPIHRCRRIYAQTLYKNFARPIEDLPADEQYVCRKDKRGVIYDRQAMAIVSLALGHSRLDVIAINYL